MTSDNLKVGLAQIAPVWLDREKTLEKMARESWRESRNLFFGFHVGAASCRE